ncbi:MAG: carboxypeptidase-like regulatory domain-containing protein [Bacteroidota bacterium]
MNKLFSCLLFCMSGIASCFSQDQIIEGVVVDAKTGQPVAYVSIGIEEKNVGTVSNDAGRFRLAIPRRFSGDSLTFSAVTHARRKLPIVSLLNGSAIVIELKETVMELRTVEIVSGKQKRNYKKLGVKPMFYWGSCYTKFRGGAQIAHLMEAGTYPVFLSKAKVKIGDNTLEKAKLRVRVIEKSENGLPGADLFKGILIDIALKEGWVEVDLSHINLILTEDFFICFEFLDVSWDSIRGYLSIVCWENRQLGKKQFVRTASLGRWQYSLPAQNHIYAIGAEVYEWK